MRSISVFEILSIGHRYGAGAASDVMGKSNLEVSCSSGHVLQELLFLLQATTINIAPMAPHRRLKKFST